MHFPFTQIHNLRMYTFVIVCHYFKTVCTVICVPALFCSVEPGSFARLCARCFTCLGHCIMGVKGLWALLSVTGVRIPLGQVASRVLAVDASLWLVQFLKAMRDAEGNVRPDAHLLGFLRRITKLLFVGIRPVFVFDGPAPALKRRTLASRYEVACYQQRLLLRNYVQTELERPECPKYAEDGREALAGAAEG